jgi:hypothetical protein
MFKSKSKKRVPKELILSFRIILKEVEKLFCNKKPYCYSDFTLQSADRHRPLDPAPTRSIHQ